MDRIILLIDMDCFYVQVEQKEQPDTVGKPCAVVQYSSTNASLIAVSYEARALGVTRNMRGDLAKKQFPNLIQFQVPSRRGKADLTKYRTAGAQVIKCISAFTDQIERASIDEAYIDATELINKANTDDSYTDVDLDRCHLVVDPSLFSHLTEGFSTEDPPHAPCLNSLPGRMDTFNHLTGGDKLKAALKLAQTIKDAILKDTSYRCSIGVAANRMLAKIACSLNKPNKITVVPSESAQHLLNFTPIKKVPNLGGKLGDDVSKRFDLKFFGALSEIPRDILLEEYGEKTGSWLYDLCRGVDRQPVSLRTLVQSIACSKNFYGKSALTQTRDVQSWFVSLAGELVERVAADRGEHGRLPTSLTVHVHCGRRESEAAAQPSPPPPAFSRALKPLVLASIKPTTEQGEDDEATQARIAEKIANLAFTAVRSVLCGSDSQTCPPIVNLGLSAGKFRSDSSLTYGNVQELLLTQANKRQAQATQEEGDPDAQDEGEVAPSPKKSSFFRQFIQVSISQAGEKPTASTHAVPEVDRAQPATGSFFRRFLNSSEPASIPETKEDNRSSANKSGPSSDADRYSMLRFVVDAKEGSTTRSKELASKIQSEVGENVNVCENATHTSGNTDITLPPSSPVDLENTLVCEECKARVLIHMMPEHTDFHFAQRLQQEWNKEQVSTVRTAQPSGRMSLLSRGTRGGRGTRKRPNAKPPASLTLDRFLSKS